MNTDRLQSLVQYTLACARDDADPWHDSLAVIHILKYAYLGDLEWARAHPGESWTGVRWRFYHFGPYDEDALDVIETTLRGINVEVVLRDHHKAEEARREYRYTGELSRTELERGLELPVKLAIRRAVRGFRNDTSALLDEVYKTAPMLHAAPNDWLDLNAGRVEEVAAEAPAAEPTKLTDRQRKKRTEALASLRTRVGAALDEALAARPTSGRPPRFDAIFQEGTEWLDSLAGDLPPSGAGTFDIDKSVWYSPTRRERLP